MFQQMPDPGADATAEDASDVCLCFLSFFREVGLTGQFLKAVMQRERQQNSGGGGGGGGGFPGQTSPVSPIAQMGGGGGGPSPQNGMFPMSPGTCASGIRQ
jgi:hypothetical protein